MSGGGGAGRRLASLASPLRYYMECLLGIFLKGSGWRRMLWPQVAAMGASAP